MAATTIDDPLFDQQWYLLNTGQNGATPGIDLNVAPVWQDYTGQGVTVGVFDTGVEYGHPDISANLDVSLSFSAMEDGADGQPVLTEDNHGMAVAGEIAAVAGNAIGGVGVAYDATVASVYLDLSEQVENSMLKAAFADALQRTAGVYDVMSNSWGFSGEFDNFNAPEGQAMGAALSQAVSEGRGGLGAIVVFAAGNDREEDFDANADNLTNSPYVISVAAVDNTGKVSSYSTPSASNLVAAPSNSYYYTWETVVIPAEEEGGEDEVIQEFVSHSYGDIVTTDRVGTLGYNTAASPAGDYAYDFGGTSAAAPLVSGVVALMLEANPALGYRDVQEILALTARNTDAAAAWTINGASTWNGGGMHASRDVGYGLVDATAAVRLAETWDRQNTTENLLVTTGEAGVGVTLPDDGTGSVSSGIAMAAGVAVERAEVVLDLATEDVSGLTVVLTSPAGTQSVLFDAPGMAGAYPANFAMTSTAFLGESSQGDWTLTVYDTKADGVAVDLEGWTLNLYGAAATDDTRYVYTNEYGTYAAEDPSRALLVDLTGTDTINASPVTAGSAVTLAPGTISLVDGAAIVLAPLTTIENLATGDGNDLLVDNDADNSLYGGRGDDVLMTGRGDDSLDGGPGFDVVGFPDIYADYTIGTDAGVLTVSSLAGVKTITNVEALSFADRVVTTDALLGTETSGTNGPLLARS